MCINISDNFSYLPLQWFQFLNWDHKHYGKYWAKLMLRQFFKSLSTSSKLLLIEKLMVLWTVILQNSSAVAKSMAGWEG